jgi:hypothetical protein
MTVNIKILSAAGRPDRGQNNDPPIYLHINEYFMSSNLIKIYDFYYM